MRVSLVAMCLVVMPWSVVLFTHLALLWTPDNVPYNARDDREIGSISNALLVYRNRYGEFPPDFSSGDPKAEIESHLRKVFPLRLAEGDLPSDISSLGPHNALYFWLQGFSADPERPLTGAGRGMSPLYRFEIKRFKGDSYYPLSGNAPFVYFHASTYHQASCQVPGSGKAFPYLSQESTRDRPVFENSISFQIITAGTDGNFGSDRVITGSTVFGAHVDNLTNFIEGPLGNAAIQRSRAHLLRTRLLSTVLALACLTSYPFVVLLRKRVNGVVQLRRLVERQTPAHTGHWKSVLRAAHERQKTEAIQRMSGRPN